MNGMRRTSPIEFFIERYAIWKYLEIKMLPRTSHCNFQQGDSSGAWTDVSVEDPFADRFTIDLGDQPQPAWQPYEVQVKAVNSQGPSLVDPLVVVGRTGEGDPGTKIICQLVYNSHPSSHNFYRGYTNQLSRAQHQVYLSRFSLGSR
jgi:hypothetical protein